MQEPVTGTSMQQSIAVLPFVNMSSDTEQEYFSDGLSEELLNLLAKIPELRVSSRTSAFSYKGKDFKISEVGRDLNVDHILEGSVRKSGNKVRITAQLIRVDEDSHMWSETWDRTLDDVFVIQDEIAAAVVAELKVRLLGAIPQTVATDPETYSLFLQARHAINQRTFESLERGETLIKRALEIDPEYVPGWVLLAFIHSAQGDIGQKLPNEAFPLARAAVERALELDPAFGRAHALLADIMVSYDRDYVGAKWEIEFALTADPTDVHTLYQAAIFEVITGNPEEGLRLSLAAVARDPLYGPNYSILTFIYNSMGRSDEAVSTARKIVELNPNANGANYYLAGTLVLAGETDEALQVIENETLDGFKFTGRAIANFVAGNKAESDAALALLKANDSGGWDYQYAVVHSVRGEADEAFAALEKAYELRDTGIQLVLGDQNLNNIRDDPRFDAFVEKMGIRLHD
jgi:TolB-like protein/Tfp pilus assembly protein PilF